MAYKHEIAARLLQYFDLGSSVAEEDHLLESARIETSAFADLFQDKVDLIPGTKGSGKSALFRIFVDFLPDVLLKSRKVVIAHGVTRTGDNVFLAFQDEFSELSEDEFVAFWCIYLISLAHEQFIKGEAYQNYLKPVTHEVEQFRSSCQKANIPQIEAKKSLFDILGWTLTVLKSWKPKASYKLPNEGGEVQIEIFGALDSNGKKTKESASRELPRYATGVKDALEAVLKKADLTIWLMIDRLDEVFPRRTEVERRALRGLLRTLRLFSSPTIRVKLFMRDDMLDQVVSGGEGFTALTHVTARQADTLRWSQDQILTMLVKRIFSNESICKALDVDPTRLDASFEYRQDCFYKVFPPTVHGGKKQSPTHKWIYTSTMDGRDVVTPRDVLELVSRAKQHQQDEFTQTPDYESQWLIGQKALLHGLKELSIRKKTTYLQAEFPHLWPHIEKFIGGKTQYSTTALLRRLGKQWEAIVNDLVAIGVLRKTTVKENIVYSFPPVYRKGLDLIRGKA